MNVTTVILKLTVYLQNLAEEECNYNLKDSCYIGDQCSVTYMTTRLSF